MILKHKAELAGRVKLQISGGERGTIDYDWFNNMILDQGISRLIARTAAYPDGGVLGFALVGSSSKPVEPTDTDLINKVATVAKKSLAFGWNVDGGYGWTVGVFEFPRGVAAGNLSEVGAAPFTGNDQLYARALIKDQYGNPTTITILPDEVLTLTWEMRRYPMELSPHIVNYTIDDIEHSTLVSYKSITAISKNNTGLGSAVLNPALISGSLPSPVNNTTYNIATKFSESQGNPSIPSARSPCSVGIPGCAFPYDETNYATFTPPIPKTNEFKCDIIWELTLSRRAP